MADRRADETPLAPRRPLGPPQGDTGPRAAEDRRPLSDRVASPVSSSSETTQHSASPVPGGASRGAPASDSSSGLPRVTARPRGVRRARLRLVHIDPWSVMKTAFLLSIALGIVTVVSVAMVWSVLGAAGVWDSINTTVSDVLGGEASNSFDVQDYIGTSRVLGFSMIVAVVDVVLITAVATLGAFLYNLAAALLGGLEVTLAEDER